MDQHEDEIEFDFFEDEPATSETQSRMRLPRRAATSNGGPRRPLGPPRGPAPLLRLLGLVAVAVLVVLGFAVLINSCADSGRKGAYSSYMERVQQIATQSSANGKRLATVLTTAGLPPQQIERRIRNIAQQEQQNVNAAQNTDPPGRLRAQNVHLVDSLALRVSGLLGLADTFKKTATEPSDDDASLLAAQAARLLASDIVWEDLFRQLSLAQLEHDEIDGVTVPSSKVITDPALVTQDGWELILQRMRASTGGDSSLTHGTNIESVKAQPGDQTLVAGQLNTVTASTELSFDVTVTNGGQAQEVGIPVTLTIDQGDGKPLTRTTKIDLIDPDESVTVSFDNLGDLQFARNTTLKVDVAPVPDESTKENNSAQYSVIFALPQ
jgi:hypothetical protein